MNKLGKTFQKRVTLPDISRNRSQHFLKKNEGRVTKNISVVYKQAFDAKSRGRSVTPSAVQAVFLRKDVSRISHISQKRCKPYFSEK